MDNLEHRTSRSLQMTETGMVSMPLPLHPHHPPQYLSHLCHHQGSRTSPLQSLDNCTKVDTSMKINMDIQQSTDFLIFTILCHFFMAVQCDNGKTHTVLFLLKAAIKLNYTISKTPLLDMFREEQVELVSVMVIACLSNISQCIRKETLKTKSILPCP